MKIFCGSYCKILLIIETFLCITLASTPYLLGFMLISESSYLFYFAKLPIVLLKTYVTNSVTYVGGEVKLELIIAFWLLFPMLRGIRYAWTALAANNFKNKVKSLEES